MAAPVAALGRYSIATTECPRRPIRPAAGPMMSLQSGPITISTRTNKRPKQLDSRASDAATRSPLARRARHDRGHLRTTAAHIDS